jgi:hypothetical protein
MLKQAPVLTESIGDLLAAATAAAQAAAVVDKARQVAGTTGHRHYETPSPAYDRREPEVHASSRPGRQ